MSDLKLGVIGYGEVGGIFSAGLAKNFTTTSAWDIKLENDIDAVPLKEKAAAAGVALVNSMQDLCANSNLIISAVTASNTILVAKQSAEHISQGTVFLDLNSASPGAKKQAAEHITKAGGVYVEAGVMTSVPPYGIKVPMLLGGVNAQSLSDQLNSYGMDTKVVSQELGIASAIKMCRSVMIKGLEALVIESYTTARAYGVEDHVLPTLYETFPSIDWEEQGRYFYSRVVMHGKRRAEEMREVANTVKEAGFDPYMAAATAEKQDWVAKLAANGIFDDIKSDDTWRAYADILLEKAR